MSVKTSVDGLKAAHAVITPRCRELRGTQGAVDFALDHLRREFMRLSSISVNREADWNFVLTVKRPKAKG